MSSFIQVGPFLRTVRHCLTAGREADDHCWAVKKKDGRSSFVHGTALVHCCRTREWRTLLGHLPGKHCRVVGRGYNLLRGPALCTVAMLDERLTSTARKWAEVAAARTIEAGEHCWVVGRGGGGKKILLRSSGNAIGHGKALVHCCWTNRAVHSSGRRCPSLDIASWHDKMASQHK